MWCLALCLEASKGGRPIREKVAFFVWRIDRSTNPGEPAHSISKEYVKEFSGFPSHSLRFVICRLTGGLSGCPANFQLMDIEESDEYFGIK
ncbi:hypothetical protein M408DRAFT_103747 [Serendipita vermifera MAFF 305830]|uniref:Uncharacterized protein n=1 Tax=Serendipita vermifera MAFF 305830 TaxID=933852 RepID=A0A0C3AN58_SERVB|nr:hypothetical protein M408DRAFT_103747 [Serendipita vermifera MAFF 305830]